MASQRKASAYLVPGIIILTILFLVFIVLTKDSVTNVIKPSPPQQGAGIKPKSLDTSKIASFAESIESFNLTQESYEQAEITLFNSGIVISKGVESVTENGLDYTHFLVIKNDQNEELTYRFTQKDIDDMLVIVVGRGIAAQAEQRTFDDILEEDDASIQNIIDLLENSEVDSYTINVFR